MRVKVDISLCQGHGQCQEVAPEVFELRDDGFAHVLVDPVDSQSADRTEDAARRCPVDAVLIAT